MYFPHIEGLRFVAALLVAVFHIWTDRISGGVDAFFALSGFLVTLVLLRQVDRDGRVDGASFFGNLALRLLPAAVLVLLVVLAAIFIALPVTQRLDSVGEVLAAMLYVENWQLAVKAVDYLDRDNPSSPVQNFWAVSVQAQFYLYIFVVFLVAFFVARQSRDRNSLFNIVLALNAILSLASIAYSVYQTFFGDQAWAYFDTFARIWEFGLGATLALVVARRPGLSLPVPFGWVGLLALLLCGIVFDVATVFPGVAALFPTTAALVVVLGGRSTDRWSVQSLLGCRAMIALGSISYGIYLIHWPLLIFYQQAFQQRPGYADGAAIIILTIGLAFLVRRFVERPVLALKSAAQPRIRLRTAAACLLPALLLTASVDAGLSYRAGRELAKVDAGAIPEARRLADLADADVRAKPAAYLPAPELVRQERPASFAGNCHLRAESDRPVWCVYGAREDFRLTIAMVGGSHTAHWLPALEAIALKHHWRILYSTWGRCRFIIDHTVERCRELSRAALESLAELRPDVLFTTASSGRDRSPARSAETWKAVRALGIPIVAVRGTPRIRIRIPECLATAPDYAACGVPRGKVLARDFDTSGLAPGVSVIDLSDYFCGRKYCPAASGGIIMYTDRDGHIAVAFMRALTGVLEDRILRAMERLPARDSSVPARAEIVRATESCEGSGELQPSSRTIDLMLGEGSLSFYRGDWKNAAGRFEVWEGSLDNSRVHIAGLFRDTGDGAPLSIDFSGTLRDGLLSAHGFRGPRTCSLSARVGTVGPVSAD